MKPINTHPLAEPCARNPETLARGTLAALRVYLGIILLVAALPKFNGNFTPHMVGFLSNVALKQGHPFSQAFINTTVLPHAELFARLVKYGELIVAITLIGGVAKRLFALVAFVLVVNYMFAKGAWFWVPSSNDGAFAVLALALAIAKSGRTFGMDRRLAQRWPKVPLW